MLSPEPWEVLETLGEGQAVGGPLPGRRPGLGAPASQAGRGVTVGARQTGHRDLRGTFPLWVYSFTKRALIEHLPCAGALLAGPPGLSPQPCPQASRVNCSRSLCSPPGGPATVPRPLCVSPAVQCGASRRPRPWFVPVLGLPGPDWCVDPLGPSPEPGRLPALEAPEGWEGRVGSVVGWGEVIPPQGEAEGPEAVRERGPTWLLSSRPRCRGGTGGGGAVFLCGRHFTPSMGSHPICTTVLGGRWCSAHFTEEETEPQVDRAGSG